MTTAPIDSVELILVRHGETDWNRELRFQGHVDVPLNAVGLAQAQRLATRLSGEAPQHLYQSDLQRAVQTAAPAAQMLGLQGLSDATLREQNFGRVDGMRVDDIRQQFPAEWAQWVRFDENYAMPDGETTHHFHARVMGALQRLATAHGGQRLLVVTHGGVLDMVYRTARSLGLNGPRQSDIPNAAYNRVRLSADTVEILDWADTRHLVDLPAQPIYNQTKLALPTQA